MSAPGIYDLAYVREQLRPGEIRYVDQELRLRSGRGYHVRERVAILAVDPDPVEPTMVRVLGYSQATDGVNGDQGYRLYPTRYGYGPTLGWVSGDDRDSVQGQWWLGPNGLAGQYVLPEGATLDDVVQIGRAGIAAREEAQDCRATHRHRRGGPEVAAARLALEDAITAAAADRDDAIIRITDALRAADQILSERTLAELSGLSRMTVRRIIGREPAGREPQPPDGTESSG